MADTLSLIHPTGVDDRVRVLRYGDEVDAFVVFGTRFTVLVDTLSTPELCAQAMELIGSSRPLLVVNTHADWDHTWGNAAVAGHAPVIAHRAAVDRVRGGDGPRTLTEKQRAEPRFGRVELVEPTITFSRDLAVDIGGLTLELRHTPGHTPDHLVVWIPQLRVCLAGDAVEDPLPELWTDEPHSLRQLMLSLHEIQALEAEVVLPSHGRTTDPEVVDRNLAYFAALTDRVAILPPQSLARAGVDDPGLRFEDLVPAPRSLSAEAAAFYRSGHASALRATVRTRLESAGS